ncbi:hypothetical protein M5X17_31225 [Paenibacillus alvei]|uniref:hypothetical protein n=1 Tax=Paenibacillus alvei TaxID=44250 RepID=UPI0022829F65|nr:hypothetical protein [Paenibacillus alvei]MCY9738166.1 hypothetical protein [Paenibacillus alvei]
MNHDEYIGKQLKELVNDAPDYAINYYLLIHKGKHKSLRSVLNNDKLLDRKIKNISKLYPDYSYYIYLE